MTLDDILTRLRGAIGNVLTWGVAWFGIALALFATLLIVGILPSTISWGDVLVYAVRAGIVGAAAGGAFSTVIGLVYRGRRLSEISWVRFGIGGGIVTGLFVPLFLQTMNLLSGDGLVPWGLVLDDGLLTAAFGTVAAGGTLKVAQLADKTLPSGHRDGVDGLEDGNRLELEGGLDAE